MGEIYLYWKEPLLVQPIIVLYHNAGSGFANNVTS